ncbi:helicase POLQ-like [Anopheles nili]|uniref:helicase POLQ-like n=1 Tax=Anopheles nili TaxID=185578 RepID=UPI00237B9F7D|nr:helicase POLQ-like [Anopheles nili]
MSKNTTNLNSRNFAMPPVRLPPKARRGLMPLDHRPQPIATTSAKPSTSSYRAPVAVRSSKRKDESSSAALMDLDNTLFNDVDLDSIQKQIESPPSVRLSTANPKQGSPSIMASRINRSQAKTPLGPKRGHSLGESSPNVASSTLKRRKSGGTPMYVLQMTMPDQPPEEKHYENPPSQTMKDSGCSDHMFAPRFDEDEHLMSEMLPCGQPTSTEQLIRDKLRKIETLRVGSQLQGQVKDDAGFEVYTNRTICTQYMRLDQTVMEANSEKIDQIRASQLESDPEGRIWQCVRSQSDGKENLPQAHQDPVSELERVFANCEQTLFDMTNLFADESSPVRMQSSLAAINWDEEVPLPEPVPAAVPPRVTSLFLDKGPFFGLPATAQRILRDFRGIKDLYDWQRECLLLPAIQERRNLIYALPTSGGKTLVAEVLMLREVLCRLRNVIFVVPYVSLAQEKMIALSPFALELQFLLEEYSGGKGQCPPRRRRKKNAIFVCTIEKSLLLLDSLVQEGRANEIGLVVIDELHMIGEPRRGANLEMLITKVQVLRAGIQIVGMSATIGNLNEVARFMMADVYCRNFRPVELKEYVKCEKDMYEVRDQNHVERSADVFGAKRPVEFTDDCSDELRRIDSDHVVRLVMQVIPESSCLVFCGTKSMCEGLCALLAQYLPARFAEHRAEEREQLVHMMQLEGSVAPILQKGIRVGAAYHHAGLTHDERRSIEDAYRSGVISVIACTSTLAAGVNLPARRVIIRSPYMGGNFLTLSRYKQMVGRAGRAGFGETGDSILICPQRDISRVCEMLCSPMDIAESALIADDRTQFKSLLLSAIGLEVCTTRNALQALVQSTLLAQQAQRRSFDLESITDQTIVDLYQGNAIKARIDSCLRNPPNMLVQIGPDSSSPQKTSTTPHQSSADPSATRAFIRVHKSPSHPGKVVKTIERTSLLEVNRLGKAAIRAGFDMERAVRYYDEMKTLGERLCVLDEYDLLHLIVLEEGNEVRHNMDMIIDVVHRLSSEKLLIAERFGIDNGTISKIFSRRFIADVPMAKVNRFVRVLIVHELWRQTPVHEVAQQYHAKAGALQSLMTNTAGTAYSLLRMSEELPEMWAFKHLLTGMTERLSQYSKLELQPLLELPLVKLGRARQLFRAGYTTLASIARATSKELVESIEHLNYRTARQLILCAKAKLMDEVDALRDQAEEYLSQLKR